MGKVLLLGLLMPGLPFGAKYAKTREGAVVLAALISFVFWSFWLLLAGASLIYYFFIRGPV